MGKIRYLKETMSVYRMFSAGSWTSRNLGNVSEERFIRTQAETTEFTTKLYRYGREQNIAAWQLDEIKKVNDRNLLQLYVLENGLKGLFSTAECRKMFWHLDAEQKYWVIDTEFKKRKRIKQREENEKNGRHQ